VRSVDLDAVAAQCLATGSRIESELALYIPGGERWFSVVATPLPGVVGAGDAAGQAGDEGLILVLNDQTRLRRLERVRKDFVANVSHELRTPIQMVKGFAETLREGGHSALEQDRWLGIIERNAVRMENLIGDLLALARLEQDDAAALELAVTPVQAMVGEAIEAIKPRAEEKNIILGHEFPEDLVARVNEGLVVQALVNLLDNAVKYCPEGTSVQVEARMEGEGAGRRLVLVVADKGPGIPARHLPRLFERFYRIDGARSRELGGTGLGLAIVKHVALAHGGTVEVESWEGEGTRFTLRLPS
jgi:two-component system phosphate regulon sensor histidine kinase PhoR